MGFHGSQANRENKSDKRLSAIVCEREWGRKMEERERVEKIDRERNTKEERGRQR